MIFLSNLGPQMLLFVTSRLYDRQVSQIPQCTYPIFYNTLLWKTICTLLFQGFVLWDMGWVHCGILKIGLFDPWILEFICIDQYKYICLQMPHLRKYMVITNWKNILNTIHLHTKPNTKVSLQVGHWIQQAKMSIAIFQDEMLCYLKLLNTLYAVMAK